MKKPIVKVMITGGAGGIGRAIVDVLGENVEGHLGLIDIDAAELAHVAERHSQGALAISTYAIDLRDGPALGKTLQGFAETAGGLDLLIANAGVMTADEPFEAASVEAIDRSIDLNFRCVVSSARAAWPYLAASRGHVLVNASQAGLHALPSDVVYSSSKAAAVMFAKANALRQRETGVRFNVVCPGVVDTPILNDQSGEQWRDEVHLFRKHYELLTPREIAETIYGLIADTDANGQIIEIANKRTKG